MRAAKGDRGGPKVVSVVAEANYHWQFLQVEASVEAVPCSRTFGAPLSDRSTLTSL
jgi:hypothetical protein